MTMDGQKACAVLLLLAALSGCDERRMFPWNRTPDPHANRKPVDLPPATVSDGKPQQLKPETLVAMGQFREQQAEEMDLTPQGREYFRDQARKAYQRALGIDPKHVPAHLALARLQERLDCHDRAMESYQQALMLEPKNAALLHEVGMAHARHKEWDKSLNLLRQAAELDPDDRACNRSYGLALARAGKVQESLVQLRKVLTEAEAHFMVARMMNHMKQDEACKQHLDRALQLDPNLGPAKEFLAELRGEPAAAVKAASHQEPFEDGEADAPPSKPAPPQPTAAAEAPQSEEE